MKKLVSDENGFHKGLRKEDAKTGDDMDDGGRGSRVCPDGAEEGSRSLVQHAGQKCHCPLVAGAQVSSELSVVV